MVFADIYMIHDFLTSYSTRSITFQINVEWHPLFYFAKYSNHFHSSLTLWRLHYLALFCSCWRSQELRYWIRSCNGYRSTGESEFWIYFWSTIQKFVYLSKTFTICYLFSPACSTSLQEVRNLNELNLKKMSVLTFCLQIKRQKVVREMSIVWTSVSLLGSIHTYDL